jgi:hypothetical protein
MTSLTIPALEPSVDNTFKLTSIIRAITSELDAHPTREYTITDLHRKYKLRRRRLYDVVNIFDAIGCATRASSTTVLWNGSAKILPCLFEQRTKHEIMNSTLTLKQMFPASNCVGLASLSMALLMMFPAMGTHTINLRQLSAFFSNETRRFKTTLCKLYQIALVLGALEITGRTAIPCEVCLKPPFTQLVTETQNQTPVKMFTIQNLLIHDSLTEEGIQKRREEFKTATAGDGE